MVAGTYTQMYFETIWAYPIIVFHIKFINKSYKARAPLARL